MRVIINIACVNLKGWRGDASLTVSGETGGVDNEYNRWLINPCLELSESPVVLFWEL